MIDRIENLASELVAEAFCADWHDDPDNGVIEIERIKNLFMKRLYEFTRDEIQYYRASVG